MAEKMTVAKLTGIVEALQEQVDNLEPQKAENVKVIKGSVATLTSPIVKIMKLDNYTHKDDPQVAKVGDAGIDLRAHEGRMIKLFPHKIHVIATGIKMAIPEGYCGIVGSCDQNCGVGIFA